MKGESDGIDRVCAGAISGATMHSDGDAEQSTEHRDPVDARARPGASAARRAGPRTRWAARPAPSDRRLGDRHQASSRPRRRGQVDSATGRRRARQATRRRARAAASSAAIGVAQRRRAAAAQRGWNAQPRGRVERAGRLAPSAGRRARAGARHRGEQRPGVRVRRVPTRPPRRGRPRRCGRGTSRRCGRRRRGRRPGRG